jgi:hypothetical protein
MFQILNVKEKDWKHDRNAGALCSRKSTLARRIVLEFVAIAAFVVMVGLFAVVPTMIKKAR